MLSKEPLCFSILTGSVARHSKHSDCKEIADLSGLIFGGEDHKASSGCFFLFQEKSVAWLT